MQVEERVVTTPPFKLMKCKECRHWITMECFGHPYPYCKRVKTDSLVLREMKCNNKYFEERNGDKDN